MSRVVVDSFLGFYERRTRERIGPSPDRKKSAIISVYGSPPAVDSYGRAFRLRIGGELR